MTIARDLRNPKCGCLPGAVNRLQSDGIAPILTFPRKGGRDFFSFSIEGEISVGDEIPLHGFALKRC
jgi:hypothetical protein